MHKALLPNGEKGLVFRAIALKLDAHQDALGL